MAKIIRTVLGDISPETIGNTLTHEHLWLDFDVAYTAPSANDVDKVQWPLEREKLWWIRQHPYSSKENIGLTAENEAIIEEVNFFKKNGGTCIVENTTKGIERNVNFLKKVSEVTGVHIVAGSGYYIGATHPASIVTTSEETLCQEFVTDITEGCDGTDIKCGVIGELGCSNPLSDNERKVLRSAAQAQRQTKCPVIIHPGRHESCPEEIIRVLSEAGGIIEKTIMSHLDRTIIDHGDLAEFASLGSYCELDLFGTEVSYYDLNPKFDMPSDAQRISAIKYLIEQGYGDKLVISHDIHTKHRLMKYGGHGYSHILLNVLPKMKQRGLSEDAIQKITVENPRQWLQF